MQNITQGHALYTRLQLEPSSPPAVVVQALLLVTCLNLRKTWQLLVISYDDQVVYGAVGQGKG